MSLSWRGPGIDTFINELTQSSAKTRRESKKKMRVYAKKILETSREGAPLDDGQLEAAHDLQIIRLSKDNIELEITVGGMVDGVNVDRYAWKMHEENYNLGPISVWKNQFSRVPVGPKFLERAVEAHENELVAAVAETLPGD